MKITVGTIFLAVAVFLDSTELISSVEPIETTLAELFPEYQQNGYLPPARTMIGNHETTTSTAFTQIGNHTLRRPGHSLNFLVRDHVIFAWLGSDRSGDNERNKDYIAPLWQLFPSLEHEERWVFDTTYNHWVTLNQSEFDKLGFGYIWALVLGQQAIAQNYRLITGNPVVDTRAHHTAYLRANEATNRLQVTEAEKINSRQTSLINSGLLITRAYIDAYDAVFREIAREARYHI